MKENKSALDPELGVSRNPAAEKFGNRMPNSLKGLEIANFVPQTWSTPKQIICNFVALDLTPKQTIVLLNLTVGPDHVILQVVGSQVTGRGSGHWR